MKKSSQFIVIVAIFIVYWVITEPYEPDAEGEELTELEKTAAKFSNLETPLSRHGWDVILKWLERKNLRHLFIEPAPGIGHFYTKEPGLGGDYVLCVLNSAADTVHINLHLSNITITGTKRSLSETLAKVNTKIPVGAFVIRDGDLDVIYRISQFITPDFDAKTMDVLFGVSAEIVYKYYSEFQLLSKPITDTTDKRFHPIDPAATHSHSY